MTFWKWSRTASSNATADGTSPWPEGMPGAQVNDSARGLMAAAAKYRDDVAGGTLTTGTATAYEVATYQGFDTLAHLDKNVIVFVPHIANGNTVTLKVDGLTPKPLRSAPSVELASGFLTAGVPVAATYYAATDECILHGVYKPAIAPLSIASTMIADKAISRRKLFLPSTQSLLMGRGSVTPLTIVGAANNGSGLIRLVVADSSSFATGQVKTVLDVAGTTEANGTWTITVVDATHIDLQGSTFTNAYVSGGTIGATFEEIVLGTGLRMSGTTLSAPAFPAFGSSRRKVIRVTGNTGFSVTADAVVMTDGSGAFSTVALNSPSVNVATNGGLDAMEGALTLAGAAWLSVWGICKADGSLPKILCNYSDTAITTMPTGYTQKALLGHLRVAANNLLMGSLQQGDRFQYVTGLAQTSVIPNIVNGVVGTYSTTTPTYAAVSVANFVPPTAREIFVLAHNTWKQLTTGALVVAPNGSWGGRSDPSGNPALLDLEANSAPPFVSPVAFMLESMNIYYAGNGAGCAVHCWGFTENI